MPKKMKMAAAKRKMKAAAPKKRSTGGLRGRITMATAKPKKRKGY